MEQLGLSEYTAEESKDHNEETTVREPTTSIELTTKKNGEIAQTLGNCVAVLQADPSLKNMFRFNEFSNQIEVHKEIKNGAGFVITNLSDTDENRLRLYLEMKYGLTCENGVPRAIDIVAHGSENRYHPIRQKLNDLRWDGVSRIYKLLPKYLGAPDNEYTRAVIKHFFLGAICRVFEPGCKFDEVICIVEDSQGAGKSTLAQFLAIDDAWFMDDIKNFDDEVAARKLSGHWIVEFGEMFAMSNTKSIEATKAFISRRKDTYRIPYAKYPQDFPRQCVFWGTSNKIDFLPNDKSGNRRFLPILTNHRNAEYHPLDNEAETRQFCLNCWAEAMEIYRSGNYSLKFPRDFEKNLEELRRDFTPEDPKVGIIQDWLDRCNYNSVCSIMIYRECFGRDTEPKRYELSEIASIMTKDISGWEKHQTASSQVRFRKYGSQRAWSRIVNNRGDADGFAPVDNVDIFT